MRSIVACVALLLAITAGDAALAQDSRDLQARDLFVAGKYAEALDVYRELHARTRHPTYLRNIGRCYQMLRQPDPAIANFRAYLREARDLGPQERAEIDGYISEMQGLRAVQAASSPLATTGPPASVAAIGQPSDRADQAPLTRKWWFWTGVGAVVVGGVITAVALSGHRTDRPPCPAATICPP